MREQRDDQEAQERAQEEAKAAATRAREQLVGATLLCCCMALLSGSGALLFTIWAGNAWGMLPPYAALASGLLATLYWWLLNRREVTSHGGFYAGLLTLLTTHPLLWLFIAIHGYITEGTFELFAPLIMTLVGFMILGLPSALLGGVVGASIARLVLPQRPRHLPPQLQEAIGEEAQREG